MRLWHWGELGASSSPLPGRRLANPAVRSFYADKLGVDLTADGEYHHTGSLKGAKHFAFWPLSMAARSCFVADAWPATTPTPRASIEFDVDGLAAATRGLQAGGQHVLVADKEASWEQRVPRLLRPEGLLVGLTVTPSLRERK